MGTCSSPVDPDAATPPEGSAVGTLADAEADSSGPHGGASGVDFPVIAGLLGVPGWTLQGLGGRSGSPGCLGHLGPSLYSQGLARPPPSDSQL